MAWHWALVSPTLPLPARGPHAVEVRVPAPVIDRSRLLRTRLPFAREDRPANVSIWVYPRALFPVETRRCSRERRPVYLLRSAPAFAYPSSRAPRRVGS